VCGPYSTVADCTDQIKVLHAKYLQAPEFAVTVSGQMVRTELDDDDVINKICNSKQSSLFMRLWQGEWEQFYGSQSQADLTMCNILAFWTGRDPVQMDRLFRRSGLYRPKWDEMHGKQTYGEMTTGKAVRDCRNVYSPVRYGDGADVSLSQLSGDGAEVEKTYEMTDTGNAHRMYDKFGGYIRYSHVSREWYIWNKKRWVVDDMGWIKKLSDIICEDLRNDAEKEEDIVFKEKKEKFAAKSASSGRKEAMITETRHLGNIPVTPPMMDSQPDLFNCQNGVLVLSTGELMPHDGALRMTKITNAEYDDSGTLAPVRWLQFMDEITGGDKALARYLQKAVGYTMSGTVQEQCAFFLYGMGNNGKSTFLDVLADIFGSYSASIQPETIMQQRNPGGGGSANPDIARLKGIRFVTCEEPSEGMRLNEGQLKQMTGGVKLSARELYGKQFEFYPAFALWVATNNKPVVRDMTHGMWRRLKIIPFKTIIPADKVDKELKYKLQKEYPGILRWCYEGYRLWKLEGLTEPPCVQAEVQEYKKEMDILATSLDTGTVMDYSADKLRAQDFFRAYIKWAKEGNEYEMSSSKFYREVGKRVEKGRDGMGIYYKGIRLREEYDPGWEKLPL
jgi:putative DNA primase/helicase